LFNLGDSCNEKVTDCFGRPGRLHQRRFGSIATWASALGYASRPDLGCTPPTARPTAPPTPPTTRTLNFGGSFDARLSSSPRWSIAQEKNGAGDEGAPPSSRAFWSRSAPAPSSASYARHDRKDSDNDCNKIAVGYHHDLSKRTTVYATYARVGNKGANALAAVAEQRPGRRRPSPPVATPAASSSASATRSDRTTGQPVFIEEPPPGAVFSLGAAIQREAADAGADAAGSVKGPFWPQAARAATADIATRTLAITTLDCIIASILRTMTADTPARSLTDAQYQALTRELLGSLAPAGRHRHRRQPNRGAARNELPQRQQDRHQHAATPAGVVVGSTQRWISLQACGRPLARHARRPRVLLGSVSA
jgi:hypothetical protein